MTGIYHSWLLNREGVFANFRSLNVLDMVPSSRISYKMSALFISVSKSIYILTLCVFSCKNVSQIVAVLPDNS